MRKLIVAAAALAVLGLSVPAGAETVIIKKRHHWHPNNHVVVIKKHRDHGWHHGWRHRGGANVVVRERF